MPPDRALPRITTSGLTPEWSIHRRLHTHTHTHYCYLTSETYMRVTKRVIYIHIYTRHSCSYCTYKATIGACNSDLLASPAEASLNLVRDEENIVLGAEITYPLQVAIIRHHHSCLTLDGLHHERAHVGVLQCGLLINTPFTTGLPVFTSDYFLILKVNTLETPGGDLSSSL